MSKTYRSAGVTGKEKWEKQEATVKYNKKKFQVVVFVSLRQQSSLN